MTEKEYKGLCKGDQVILQVQGHLKGQKGIVQSYPYGTEMVVVYLEEKKYHVVYHYHKLRKA